MRVRLKREGECAIQDDVKAGGGLKGWEGMKKRSRNLQQSQRDIALQPGLELDLDVEVQAELQPDGLGVGQTGQDGWALEAAGLVGLGERLVVSSAATAARVNRGREVRGGVVKLRGGSSC